MYWETALSNSQDTREDSGSHQFGFPSLFCSTQQGKQHANGMHCRGQRKSQNPGSRECEITLQQVSSVHMLQLPFSKHSSSLLNLQQSYFGILKVSHQMLSPGKQNQIKHCKTEHSPSPHPTLLITRCPLKSGRSWSFSLFLSDGLCLPGLSICAVFSAANADGILRVEDVSAEHCGNCHEWSYKNGRKRDQGLTRKLPC